MQKRRGPLQRTMIPISALVLSAWAVQAWDKRIPPPAGDYPCLTSRLGYSSVQGPAGPLMTIQYDPSVLGTLHLDGKGSYRTSRSSGRYSFDAATGKFTFVSGGLAGWPVVYEVKKGIPTVRLAATKDKGINAAGRVGDHACRRRGTERFPDTGTTPGKESRKSDGPLNANLRGTLTFKEEWGSKRIVDVNLATGELTARFDGTDPFRTSKGETALVNPQGELVILARDGTVAARIPTETRDKRPDLAVLSPDGSKIAYHVEPIYYDSRVIVATREGKKVAEFKGVTTPDWTPEGRLVVANSLGVQGAKAAISLSDAELKQLTRIDRNLDDARMPAVSSDGTQIAFTNHGHLWVMNRDGSDLKQVTSTAAAEERPSWSPDGKSLAYATREYGVVCIVSLATGKTIEVRNRDGKTMQSRGRITWR